jgi:hypothetical protein
LLLVPKHVAYSLLDPSRTSFPVARVA